MLYMYILHIAYNKPNFSLGICPVKVDKHKSSRSPLCVFWNTKCISCNNIFSVNLS